MAVASSYSVFTYKDKFHPATEVIKRFKRKTSNDSLPSQMVCRCLFHCKAGESSTRCHVEDHQFKLLSKVKQKADLFYMVQMQRSRKFLKPTELPCQVVYGTDNHKSSSSGDAHQGAKPHTGFSALETANKERQLKALDSYFSKLHDEKAEQQNSWAPASELETIFDIEERQMKSLSQLRVKTTETIDPRDKDKAKTGLGSLENYFVQLDNGKDRRKRSSTSSEEVPRKSPTEMANRTFVEFDREDRMMTEQSSKHLENVEEESSPILSGNGKIQDSNTYDEASDFHLISILAAINIAVFLFEIASPVRNSDVEQLSLPLIYGAKINKLILVGEWWRLLTPMFLHSGLLHVSLGCWMLLTFGPQVCRGYGPFTFFLIYLLGGISGNLTSFIHTPELTVCGTGPVFAIIGAWLVYQNQNKAVISRDASESMFWKAVIATALSFLLSNFGRIDDWTHLGATLSGIVFGFLTCPTLQLDNASPDNGQKEGIALVQRQADPCKSLATFSAIMLVLSFVVLSFGPQLAELELDGIV